MASIRLYTHPADEGSIDVVMVLPYVCADGERGEVTATFEPAQARALAAALLAKASAIQRAEAGAEQTAAAVLKRVQAEECWPHGATVKLGLVGFAGPCCKAGWAKRNGRGQLVSVYSDYVLDPEMWNVIEERPDGHPSEAGG